MAIVDGTSHETPRRTGSGTRRGLTVLGLAAVAVLAFAAYRFFTNRPGEAAIQDIPADATLVATFDGTPSPMQVAAFAKIEAAMKREGVSDLSADFFDRTLSGNAFAKDIKPYVSKNFAAAMWGNTSEGKTPSPMANVPPSPMANLPSEGAIFIALTDPGKVQAALQKDCQPGPDGLYRLTNCSMLAGVLDNYLVLASSEARYNQIVKVSKGQLPSVANLSAYKDARAALPSDSNLMVFISPDIYKALHTTMPTTAWCSLGAEVRGDGLALSCRFPSGADTFGTAPALDQAVLKELPAGAYGVLCYSDPSKWYEAVQKQGETTGKMIHEANDKMRKQVGLDINADIMPGLKGDAEFAVYPAVHGQVPEFLLMLDSEHGSDPVALAQKVRDSIQSHRSQWGNAVVTQRQEGPATVWRVNDPSQKQTANYGGGGFSYVDVVQMNNTVFLTSSEDLTQKVVSLQPGQTLADDAPFVSMSKTLKPNAQSIMMVSMYRILSTFEHSNPEVGKWTTVFGGPGAGMVGSTSYNATTGVGELFIPLDWDKAIRFLGQAGRGSRGPTSVPAGNVS